MNTKINFEKYCNESALWVSEVAEHMRTPDRPDWAFNALKAVLHTIRDRTTTEEVFHLSAQLPVLIRGFYFEGYKPTNKPVKLNSDEFLQLVKKRMGPGMEVSMAEAIRAVLSVLYDRTSHGELSDIKGSMPKDLQKLWNSLMPKETELE
jgi:uncharacterized protein (DUF2267 family)